MEQQIYAEQIEGATTRLDEEIDRLKSEITSLNNEVREKEIVRDQLRIIAQEEADGTGGSKRRNLGPIYKVKKADADKLKKGNLISQRCFPYLIALSFTLLNL